MWEPNADLNKYGTPMVLMTITFVHTPLKYGGIVF